MSAENVSSQWTVVKPQRRCPLPTDNMYLEARIAITDGSDSDTDSKEKPKLTYFHKFPELPKELRDRIWKAALPGPRSIEVRSRHYSPERIDENPNLITGLAESMGAPFFGVRSFKYTAMEKAPAMFFVNKEARCNITKYYSPYKGYSLHKNGDIVSTPAVYADFNIDILSFTRHTHIDIPSFLEQFPVNALKHVAFNHGITRGLNPAFTNPFPLSIYILVPGLESIGISFNTYVPLRQKQQVVGFVDSRSPVGEALVRNPVSSLVQQVRKSYMEAVQDRFVIEQDSKLGESRTVGDSLGSENERVRVYDGVFVYAEDVTPGTEGEWGFSWTNSIYLPDGTFKD